MTTGTENNDTAETLDQLKSRLRRIEDFIDNAPSGRDHEAVLIIGAQEDADELRERIAAMESDDLTPAAPTA